MCPDGNTKIDGGAWVEGHSGACPTDLEAEGGRHRHRGGGSAHEGGLILGGDRIGERRSGAAVSPPPETKRRSTPRGIRTRKEGNACLGMCPSAGERDFGARGEGRPRPLCFAGQGQGGAWGRRAPPPPLTHSTRGGGQPEVLVARWGFRPGRGPGSQRNQWAGGWVVSWSKGRGEESEEGGQLPRAAARGAGHGAGWLSTEWGSTAVMRRDAGGRGGCGAGGSPAHTDSNILPL